MAKSKKDTELLNEFPPISTERWEEQIVKDLKGADYEKKLVWKPSEGLNIRPYYRAEDLKNLDYLNALPGSFPFVRGKNTKTNSWEIRQEIIVNDITQANQMALEAIGRGAEGISFRLKFLSSEEELDKLLAGIDLTKTALHFSAVYSFTILSEMLLAVLKKRKINPAKVHGSFNFDSLGYCLLHGQFFNTREDNYQEALSIFRIVTDKLTGFRVINVKASQFHNGGASIVQELGFAMAAGNEYLASLTGLGLDVDDVCNRMQFTFAVGSDYFLEIAKLRAARLLWARIVEQYHPEKESSACAYIHTTTSLWNKTLYDPYVNILRGTTETMSAAIAGTDAITVLPLDIAYRDADEFSSRLSRNTQIVLREEAHLDKVVDAAAGSYYIESLTDSIAELAWKLFLDVEDLGGMGNALESGFVKDEIMKTRVKRDMDIAMRKSPILGTSIFPNLNETMLTEIQRVEEVGSKGGLQIYRAAHAFEDLRLATEAWVQDGGVRPKVFLLIYGNLAMRKARATFSANFFGVAGYAVTEEKEFNNIDWMLNAVTSENADIVVICSSDEDYAKYADEIATALKKKDKDILVVVAGNPKELIEPLKKAGVDEFIHVRSDILATLKKCHKHIGI